MASILDLTLGALELGTLLSVALYGLITLQVYIYYQVVYHDHVIIRTLVPVVWILDTIHTIFLFISLYDKTVTNYGKPESIKDIHWPFVAVVFLNGLSPFAIQSFFSYRIKVLSGRLAIGLFSWAVCVARMGTTLMLVILTAKTKDFGSYIEKYQWTVPVAASVMAFGDVLNTSAMCFLLSIRKTGHRHTNHLIAKAIQWTIETGLVTTICAVATIVLCVAMSESLIWIGLYLCFPKLYSISMLVSLNNREKLRNEASSERFKEGTLASSMQFLFSRPQEAPAIEMVPMKLGDGWDGLGPKPAPLE